jgi:electron transfer flavoprotein alpha subunit
VTAAAQCGGEVHVLVAGLNAGAAAQAAGQIAGVSRVIHVEGVHFEHGLAENMAAQVLALAPAYSHILFPATASGKNIAPRVAATLDVGQISDITKVDSPDTRLACLQLRLILVSTRLVAPKWGCSKYMFAANHETIFVDLWAMSSTSCGKRAAMHWFS